jgi:F-type H+-transporting ATPase subunit gamma
MASARELRKKIRSISNTKKITRTMELVATAKSKRTQDRVNATTPYAAALADLLRDLSRGEVHHPLIDPPAAGKPTVVFVVTGNRGLCGGYNTNVLALAEKAIEDERAAGRAVEVYMAGRKGISRFRFLGIPLKERFLALDDRATFADSAAVAEGLLRRFTGGEIGKVLAVYTAYLSASVQRPEISQILPIRAPEGNGTEAAPTAGAPGGARAAGVEYLFEPDQRSILEALLPLSVQTALHRIVLQAAASEQVARRLAMKLATDNAEEMIRFYNRTYNRTRQAGITQQINEIVSGANALE